MSSSILHKTDFCRKTCGRAFLIWLDKTSVDSKWLSLRSTEIEIFSKLRAWRRLCLAACMQTQQLAPT